MDLPHFNEDPQVYEDFRQCLWDRREALKDLSWMKGEKHVINMQPGAKLEVIPGRLLSPAEGRTEAEMVRKLDATGILDPFVSAYADRNVFVHKKNHGLAALATFVLRTLKQFPADTLPKTLFDTRSDCLRSAFSLYQNE